MVIFENLPPRRKWWHLALAITGFTVLCGVCAAFLGFAALNIAFSRGLPQMSSANDYRPKIVSRFYSADDQLSGEFSTERRVILPFERIPKTLVQAFMASEDAHFFDHQGIDYSGLVRSAIKTATEHGQQGGSTISMQVAKSFLDSDVRKGAKSKSLLAKIRYKGSQILFARQLEQTLQKSEILYLYLNQIYLGHGAYGVQAAAENYFRKNVWELTLNEQALIAGLPQAPSRFSPFTHPERARERQKYVLRRMLEEKFITQKEHDDALAEPIRVKPLEDPFRDMAPNFVETVRRQIADRYGDKALYEEGLEVYTTLDLERQHAAEVAAAEGLHDLDKRQGFRGPLANIDKTQEKAFLDKYQKTLPDKLQQGETYVALVTEVTKDRAVIQIGKTKAQIPIAAMRWARKPNPLVYFEYSLQDDATRVLHKGDVVLAKMETKSELIHDQKNASVLAGKIADDLPMTALEQEPIAETALLSADPHTGYVVAMVGGYNFDASELNRTMQSCRQPGSAFKPIIYSAAFDTQGFTASTILQDSPVVFTDDNLRWKPENSHAEFKGDVTVRTALQMSLNIPAVKTLQKVGIETALQYARRLGITTPINRDFSMALGGSCVKMWDLLGAYGVFDNLGYKPRFQLIRRVVDRDGRVLESHGALNDPTLPLAAKLKAARDQVYHPLEMVLDPTTAYLIMRQLTNVVNGGTGSYAAKVGKNVAGKTGTTNDQFDAWFMGFSRDLVTGVWVGHDKNERPLGALEFGGRAALPIWTDYMMSALKGIEQPPHEKPENVIGIRIDPETGLVAGNGRAVVEYYKIGTEPKSSHEQSSGDEFYKVDN